MDLENGWVGKNYRLGPMIGQGNQASVFLGIDVRRRKRVAVKVVNNKMNFCKAENEIKVLKRINHPHIVQALDVIEDSDYTCIVTEYYEGGELFDILAKYKSFTESKAAEVMREIFEAVLYLHENGIIHRDLKPENILCVNKKWPLQIKLADFGLSVIAEENKYEARQMVGTPQYVAPEMLCQKTYTNAVDLWSCGVILYMLLAGKFPFYGETREEMLGKVIKGKYEFDEKQWSSISYSAKDLVSSLLELDVNKRLTAQEALRHPFLRNEDLHPIGNDLSKIHSARRQFRRIVSAAVLVNRLQNNAREK